MEIVLEPVKEGTAAPDFRLASSNGTATLNHYLGRRNVVLYFMREFNCAVCRRHLVQLDKMYPELQARKVEVLVIGGGSLEEANRLAAAYKLPFAVAADTDREVYRRYGLHKAMGLLQRSGSILVGRSGRVLYVQRATLPTGALDKKELMSAIEQL